MAADHPNQVIGPRTGCGYDADSAEDGTALSTLAPRTSPGRFRRWLRRLRLASLAALLVFLAVVGYGVSGADAERLRVFSNAVDRWQVNPEFRAVGREYAVLGYEAMRARFWGISTTRVVMALRSLPGLPATLDVDPTSQKHYDSFAAGPLAAYLHLCSEGNTQDIIPLLEELARRPVITEQDLERFLRQNFQLDHPVVTDEGARSSLRRLMADTDAGRPFAVRGNVDTALPHYLGHLAAQRGWGGDVRRLPPEQQYEIMRVMDAELRTLNAELWRTKQVNDLVGGVWAQVYGPMYHIMIKPVLFLRAVGRYGTPAVMLLVIVRIVQARRHRRGPMGDPQQDRADSPAEKRSIDAPPA